MSFYLSMQPDVRSEICRLYKGGMSGPKISRSLNVSSASVQRVVKRAGIVRSASECQRSPLSVEQRFWLKVKKTGSCWLWIGGLVEGGYGNFTVRLPDRKTANHAAHRYAYELLVGPVPSGLELDHLCRVRSYVNPAHLEPVTSLENKLRGTGFIAVNARKTHCVNGHALIDSNLILRLKPARFCLACSRTFAREFQRRVRARKIASRPSDYRRHNGNSIKTHCKRGHQFDGANTHNYNGMRFCRACRRLRGKGELK